MRSGWASPLSLALLLLAASALCLGQGSAAQRSWRSLPPPLSRPFPDGLERVTLLAALGDHARIAADWRYIDALQYIGDNLNIDDGYFQRAAAIYTEILWVDPGFRHAVREGAALLGWPLNRPRQAAELLQRAIAYDTDQSAHSKRERDRLRLYLAALAYQKLKDDNGVLDALRSEALRPDAPEMLLRMLGNLYLRNRDWQGAQKYWTWVLSRAPGAETRLVAERALQQAAAGLSPGQGR